MDNELRREIIVDNYNNPFNKGIVNDEGYIRVNTNNLSCIDNIDVIMKIKNGIVVDARFDGEACAITTSATSIMIRKLVGKSIEEIKNIRDNYRNMINEVEYDRDLLGDLLVYDEVYKQANRKKCALMPFDALDKILLEYSKDNNC